MIIIYGRESNWEESDLALIQADFYSDVLGRGAQLCAVLPDGPAPAGGFPTLFLLHGMTDDCTLWTRRTSIERYAEDRRLAVIMPDTRLGWYANTHAGERYFDHVSDEVVRFSRRMLPGLSRSRETTFIAGQSMGGYGALRCALNRPELFSRAASLSGALDIAEIVRPEGTLGDPAYWEDTFGPAESIPGSEHDLYRAARELTQNRPEIWMWCGKSDFLYSLNLRMRDHLRALGYALTYTEGPGGHEWRCWDEQIQNIIDWLVPAEEVSACR